MLTFYRAIRLHVSNLQHKPGLWLSGPELHESYPGYFGFICVEWEEVETRHASVYTVYDSHTHNWQRLLLSIFSSSASA